MRCKKWNGKGQLQLSVQELQRKVEENKNEIKELIENNSEGRTLADVIGTPEKRTVEEVTKKSLNERDNEKKERQIRKRNMIIFELHESKKPKDKKEKYISSS